MINIATLTPIQSLLGVPGDMQLLLLGVALGAIPTSELSNILVAFLGKKLGVKPGEITSYNKAASASDGDDSDSEIKTDTGAG